MKPRVPKKVSLMIIPSELLLRYGTLEQRVPSGSPDLGEYPFNWRAASYIRKPGGDVSKIRKLCLKVPSSFGRSTRQLHGMRLAPSVMRRPHTAYGDRRTIAQTDGSREGTPRRMGGIGE